MNCCICGKELTDPISIKRGTGDICNQRLKEFDAIDSSSNYYCDVQEINNKKVGLVIDRDIGGASVTNSIEKVAKENDVEYIIYRDTLGNYDYWSVKDGFKSLALNGIPTKDLDDAISIAKARFIQIGGLFN